MTDLRIETYRMPGADLGPKNPLPAFHLPDPLAGLRIHENIPQEHREYIGYGCEYECLPYRIQDGYNRAQEVREFPVAVLENEILRATFLLSLGGRLWSLIHKPENREMLLVNPVFQPGNLAVRDAWFSGGVEWNACIRGHSPFSCSPVFAAKVPEGKRGPILRLYEWERVRQVPYQIDFCLPEGSSFLFVFVRLSNPHDHAIPMYWWSNIAVEEKPGLRVLAPANHASYHSYEDEIQCVPIPLNSGVDLTYPANLQQSADYFYWVAEGRRPWVAALDTEGVGLIQTSTRLLRGRKLFVWGMHSGGRRWQRFLTSGEGRPYIEIQAGLARTQYESLPMPAGAKWSWLEAYGLMEAETNRVHGADWQDACAAVNERLDELIPAKQLQREFEGAKESADLSPSEILQEGSGWGALERLLRERMGKRPACSAFLPFEQSSIGPEESCWLHLLNEGYLPYQSPDRSPGAYMVQEEWCHLLEVSRSHSKGDHWLTWLHLGIMSYRHGAKEAARQAWERSLELEPSAWAYRNLAVLVEHEGEISKAAELYLAAHRLLPASAPLAIECGEVLLRAEKIDMLGGFLEKLPPDVRQHGRIQLLETRVALETGDLQKVKTFLESEEVPIHVREGETTLTDLWSKYQEKLLAVRENIPLNEELRLRVRSQCQPPPCIDFRLFVSGSDT